MTKEKAVYSHGHHASVVNSHARRTAQNSAAFLLSHIKRTDQILDLGCGPGSITIDLAELVPEGQVRGVDAVASVLDQARSSAASRGVNNVTFESVDANALPYADGTFDIVFCHQLLQHVQDPVGILREMKRVCNPQGIVAARESIYSSFAWYPAHLQLSAWQEIYLKQAAANGGEPDAGKFLHAWAAEAGFKPADVQTSVTSWCYTGQTAKTWGDMWADRAIHSNFKPISIEKGFATEEDIQAIAKGWREWRDFEHAWFNVPSGEILCRNSS
ncbi:ubiE/COQ5 methyltransferase [Acrodontium crateriforme]|uniref:UbiE/COQ5 methyltransferase n=1 Tax=Acrodontium crateriforme TaxID=150365 RepID=A0AAQ3MBJ4_9PEZI|nr:ubiE/COQ5 methyltransferase [Acrodontium crateriforme]